MRKAAREIAQVRKDGQDTRQRLEGAPTEADVDALAETLIDAVGFSDPLENLTAAIEHVEKHHPLPRCEHGKALRDGAGEQLEPPCGCTDTNRDPLPGEPHYFEVKRKTPDKRFSKRQGRDMQENEQRSRKSTPPHKPEDFQVFNSGDEYASTFPLAPRRTKFQPVMERIIEALKDKPDGAVIVLSPPTGQKLHTFRDGLRRAAENLKAKITIEQVGKYGHLKAIKAAPVKAIRQRPTR